MSDDKNDDRVFKIRKCFIHLSCPNDEFGLSFPSGSGENAEVKSKARDELPIKSDRTQEKPKLFDVGWPIVG